MPIAAEVCTEQGRQTPPSPCTAKGSVHTLPSNTTIGLCPDFPRGKNKSITKQNTFWYKAERAANGIIILGCSILQYLSSFYYCYPKISPSGFSLEVKSVRVYVFLLYAFKRERNTVPYKLVIISSIYKKPQRRRSLGWVCRILGKKKKVYSKVFSISNVPGIAVRSESILNSLGLRNDFPPRS